MVDKLSALALASGVADNLERAQSPDLRKGKASSRTIARGANDGGRWEENPSPAQLLVRGSG